MAPKPPWARGRQPPRGNSTSTPAAAEGDPSSARTAGESTAGAQGEKVHNGARTPDLVPSRLRLPGEGAEAVPGGVGVGGQGTGGGGRGGPAGASGGAEALASADEEQDDDDWVLSEFRNECRIVRRALEGDFNKVRLGLWREAHLA